MKRLIVLILLIVLFSGVAELADAHDLGSCAKWQNHNKCNSSMGLQTVFYTP
ncbi:MAG TPA: hypothetical protein GX526_04015 [Thermoanaerobacterales bacterium]|nr:hypothetical protein [Thermoanaerobacterales bacterium]